MFPDDYQQSTRHTSPTQAQYEDSSMCKTESFIYRFIVFVCSLIWSHHSQRKSMLFSLLFAISVLLIYKIVFKQSQSNISAAISAFTYIYLCNIDFNISGYSLTINLLTLILISILISNSSSLIPTILILGLISLFNTKWAISLVTFIISYYILCNWLIAKLGLFFLSILLTILCYILSPYECDIYSSYQFLLYIITLALIFIFGKKNKREHYIPYIIVIQFCLIFSFVLDYFDFSRYLPIYIILYGSNLPIVLLLFIPVLLKYFFFSY